MAFLTKPVPRHSGTYWLVAFLLCLVGFVGLFSFGAPLLLLGIAMLVVSPWRTSRTVVWPTGAGVAVFVFAYLLSAPLGCTAQAVPQGGSGRTVCTNILGLDYSGATPYHPAYTPALAVLFGVALAVAVLVRRALAGRQGSPSELVSNGVSGAAPG